MSNLRIFDTLECPRHLASTLLLFIGIDLFISSPCTDCLSVATEIRRMILGGEPAFERVRAVLENDPSASELLLRCRVHLHRAHIDRIVRGAFPSC